MNALKSWSPLRWRYGNCLVFCLVLWFSQGGAILMESRRHGWVPRWFYQGADGQWLTFVPDSRVDWRRLPRWQQVLPFHVVLFKGRAQAERPRSIARSA